VLTSQPAKPEPIVQEERKEIDNNWPTKMLDDQPESERSAPSHANQNADIAADLNAR